MDTYKVGSIVSGRELGLSSGRHMLVECRMCGKQRWAVVKFALHSHSLCRECAILQSKLQFNLGHKSDE